MSKKLFSKVIVTVLAIVLCFSFTACNDEGVKPTPPPKNLIVLNKTSLSLKVGENETLIATATPSDLAITWASSATAIATVDSKGKIVALSAGTAKISAANGDTKAECTVTVSDIPQ